MNEINRAAYITALQGLLVAATDAQLDTLWCTATKMILEQGETAQRQIKRYGNCALVLSRMS